MATPLEATAVDLKEIDEAKLLSGEIDIASLSRPQLLYELAQRELSTDGTKAQLRERLLAFVHERLTWQLAHIGSTFGAKRRAVELEQAGSAYGVGFNCCGDGLVYDRWVAVPELRGKNLDAVVASDDCFVGVSESGEVYAWGGQGAAEVVALGATTAGQQKRAAIASGTSSGAGGGGRSSSSGHSHSHSHSNSSSVALSHPGAAAVAQSAGTLSPGFLLRQLQQSGSLSVEDGRAADAADALVARPSSPVPPAADLRGLQAIGGVGWEPHASALAPLQTSHALPSHHSSQLSVAERQRGEAVSRAQEAAFDPRASLRLPPNPADGSDNPLALALAQAQAHISGDSSRATVSTSGALSLSKQHNLQVRRVPSAAEDEAAAAPAAVAPGRGVALPSAGGATAAASNSISGAGGADLWFQRPSAIPRLSSEGVAGVAAGHGYAAAVSSGGDAWMWGWGRLGIQDSEDEPLPPAAFAVASTSAGPIAIHEEDVCDGTARALYHPRPIHYFETRVPNWQMDSIAFARDAMFILTTDGTVYAHGSNVRGRCGVEASVVQYLSEEGGVAWHTGSRPPTQGERLVASRAGTRASSRERMRQRATATASAAAATATAAPPTQTELQTAATKEKEESWVGRPTPLLTFARAHVRVRQIACGAVHALALTDSPAQPVWSWGHGEGFRLGHGDAEDRVTPTPVAALAGFHVSQVAAGWWHSAAVASRLPVMEGGLVYTWGTGTAGQLGLGSALPISALPAPVVTLEALGISTIFLSASASHNVAMAHDHTLWAWGSNKFGCLGAGDRCTADLSYIPLQCDAFDCLVDGVGRGVPRCVAAGRECTLVTCYPYYGASAPEAEHQNRARNILDAEARAKAEAQRVRLDAERVQRMREEAERASGAASSWSRLPPCSLCGGCHGFAPDAYAPNLCKRCGHLKSRHSNVQ